MREDYLWDRSGPPDPEIVELERVLGALGHGRARPKPYWRMAAAAALLLGAALWQMQPRPLSGWETADGAVRSGQVLRTGNGAVTMHAGDIGRVELGPDSELRVVARERLGLRRGSLRAFIWAPPRRFVVDTPSARAVDLGCAYTLRVDGEGNGVVEVESGWVAFEQDGRESLIPAGAGCLTRKRTGPGIPYYLDAPAELRAALREFEETGRGLDRLLQAARPRDGLTLWHLLARTADGAVLDRFAELIGMPEGVTRQGVLAKDRAMLDLCWKALQLETTW